MYVVCLLNFWKRLIKKEQLQLGPFLFLAFLYISTGNTEISFTMLILPPDGVGDALNVKRSADPLQGLVEALLGEDEASQVCLHTPGHEEVSQ